MTFDIGEVVKFERDRGAAITGTATSIQGGEPYRVIGLRSPEVAETTRFPSGT